MAMAGGVDVTALAVAIIGASSGGWAFLQSRSSSRDRRREKQSPLLREQQALRDERESSRSTYERLTAENARLDKALEEAYRDLDAERARVRDLRGEYDRVDTALNVLQHQHDTLVAVHEITTQNLTQMTAHAASLETTALHVAISHQHDGPAGDADDTLGP